MHILVQVDWDDEGMGLRECNLPQTVIVLDVPENYFDSRELWDKVSEQLSETFGFNHFNLVCQRIELNRTYSGVESFGICQYRE
jgi:hypothetical protein